MFDVRTRGGKVRPATIRKSAKDGTFTPTEQLKKNSLMKQFAKFGRKGYEVASGSSKEYRDNYDAVFRHPEGCDCGSCGEWWKK